MTRQRWLRLGACSVGVIAACAAAHGAPADDPRTVDQKAVDAQTALRYEAAAKYFQTFIDSAVGDPRVDKARRQLHDCGMALAKEWAADGREAEAAKLYLWLAEDGLTPAESKPAMVKQAATLLTTALTEAKHKRLFARALQLHQDWLGIFPDRASPLSVEDLESLAADGLISACQDKFNLLALPDVARQYYPDREPAWDDLAKRSRGESLQLGYYRTLSEVGWAGRYVAEYELLAKDSPLRSNQAFCNQLEKMLVARAEAWAAQGNVPLTTEAVSAAKALLVTDSKIAALRALEAKLSKGAATEPRELSFPGPVKGKVTWQDSGAGYTAQDVLLDEDADITVKPGFVLTGGKLELQRAHLHLLGTAAQPVVFREVSISLQPGSSIEAENAVFINCSFSRAGETMFMKYASKWVFSGCLFYRTHFASLGIASMGLRMNNCAWVEGKIPERVVHSNDAAATFKDRWNDVKNCLFFRTEVSPSTVWMTEQSNFVRCSLSGNSQYDSKTPLLVALFVPEGDPVGPKLRANTLVSDKGDLRYVFAHKTFDVAVPPQFWALLPVEGPDVAKPERQGR